jgi:hypothetical protein
MGLEFFFLISKNAYPQSGWKTPVCEKKLGYQGLDKAVFRLGYVWTCLGNGPTNSVQIGNIRAGRIANLIDPARKDAVEHLES